jgi:hypothetical protein
MEAVKQTYAVTPKGVKARARVFVPVPLPTPAGPAPARTRLLEKAPDSP